MGDVRAGPARFESLQGIPLFAGLSSDALQRLADAAAEVELPAGHILIERGHLGAGLLVIEDGTAEVEAGEERFQVGPGDFLGDLALLAEGITHTARVRATTPVRCLAIRRDDFGDLLHSEPRIAVAMLPVLARRMAQLMSYV